MDKKFEQILEEICNADFVDGIISNATKATDITKIKIRPVLLKGTLKFQVTKYKGKQVFHENMDKEQLLNGAREWFAEENLKFKQAEFSTKSARITALISKKGKVTIKQKKLEKAPQEFVMDLSHNRAKRYILQEGIVVPFLVDLGVMTKDGKIVRTRYDKFKQINRFLEFLEDALPNLPKDRELTILDFGCGKSYLTFAMYYYLHELKKRNIRIIGLDLKKDVIENCNTLSEKYGYEKLLFLEGDIADYEGVDSVDMVVTLHACDTATDYALYKAVKWGAEVILSVPCCQHELNGQLHPEGWDSIFQYGIIKERSAALFTDALRANLLSAQGYKTQILEFIDMEHTPKNLLIRAIRQKNAKPSIEKMQECEQMEKMLGCNLTLGRLLKEEGK